MGNERFKYKTHKNGCDQVVYLDGKKVGEIRYWQGCWAYYPNGDKTGGDRFLQIAQVKKSIEAE